MPMVINILASGIKTRKMDRVFMFTNKQEKNMMAIGKMGKKVELEDLHLLKAISMKENSNKDIRMGSAKLSTNQAVNSKELLSITKLKVKVK